MNKTKILIKASYRGIKFKDILNQSFTFKNKKNNKIHKNFSNILIAIGLTVALGSFGGMFYFNYSSINQIVTILLEREDGGVYMSLLASFIILLAFSFIYAGQILYKGKDLKLLLTLPITPKEFLFSRLWVLYLDIIPYHLIIVIPALINLFIKSKFNFNFILGTFTVLILFPLVPIFIASLFAMLVVRFGQKGRDKTTLEMIVLTLLLLVIVILQTRFSEKLMSIITSLINNNLSQQSVDALIKLGQGFFQYGFIITYASASLFNLSYLMKFVAFSAAIVLFLFYLIQNNYLKCLNMNHNTSVKKQKKQKELLVSSSITKVLIKREWEIIKSNSYFMFEIIGEALVPLILIIVYSLMGILGDMMSGLDLIESQPYFPSIICGVLALFASFSQISATSFSREGKQFVLGKTLPIESLSYFKAKVLFHVIIMGIPNLFFAIIAVFFFKISIINLTWIIPINLLIVLNSSYLGLMVDGNKPYLNWTSAQQAVKQNINGLKGIGWTFLLLILTVGVYYLTSLISFTLAAILSIALLLAVTPKLSKISKKKVQTLYSLSSDLYF